MSNDRTQLKDIQGGPDFRKLPIQKVGIRHIRYPITVRDKSHEKQNTVASVTFSVNLPHSDRGTHMSRFVEVLDRFKNEVSYHTLDAILVETARTLQAEEAHIELAFPFFLRKQAPISGLESTMSYDCVIYADYRDRLEIATRVEVPVHTLCPCSKEISQYSAHNQRGTVVITVGMTRFIWIEDLIEVAEDAASSPLYALLKREDEKFVTERAYENPRFVEDVVREVALRLDRLPGLRFYTIEVENFESIHNHSAYAVISKRFDEE
ncbi:MAG TPA: GTP cyclohydrolase FolE2 [Spirochaetia bacterium]|nr:GTP cyclohydrolase FolE2 [Spirochaetia bacterium]